MDTALANIEKFLIEEATPIKQGLVEWHNQISLTIGGSELAILFGEHDDNIKHPKTVEQLLEDKLYGPKDDNLKLPCAWGTMFQCVATKFVERKFDSTMLATDVMFAPFEGFRLSPDGIMPIRVRKGTNQIISIKNESVKNNGKLTASENQYDVKIVHIEIKCPIGSRVPTKGLIPKQYISQVLAALAVIPICDFSFFIDCQIRLCSFNNIGTRVCSKFHVTEKPNCDPIDSGIFIIKSKTKEGKKWIMSTKEQLPYVYQSMVDLSTLSRFAITEVFNHIDKKDLEYTVHFGTKDTLKPIIIANIAEDACLLSWQIFNVAFTPVARQPGYLDRIKSVVEPFIKRLNEMRIAMNDSTHAEQPPAQLVN
jgi:hypothetical protein